MFTGGQRGLVHQVNGGSFGENSFASDGFSVKHREMLRATSITKSYGEVKALKGVDLDVDQGSVVSLLGRNGAGKSTLLSTIAGLLEPDSGTVIVDGVDLWKHPKRAAPLVGIAPQETGIYRAVTVRDNLRFFAELSGLRREACSLRVDEVAERLSLTELLDRKATQLSGGEARRLHTACALVHRPQLLLLDEPTVGADVATRNELISAVRDLAEEGAAVIYTTHYLPEVEALAADIVIIDNGLALARGTQNELIERYRTDGIEVDFEQPVDELHVEAFPVSKVGPATWRCVGVDSLAAATAALELIANLPQVVSARHIRPDLERVFLEVTGRALGDDETQPGSASEGLS